MPAVIEEKALESDLINVLSDIEKTMSVVTILRFGRPVARLVPMGQVRRIEPIPNYSDRVEINCDLFADESGLWENA